jgi:hypothetical protein
MEESKKKQTDPKRLKITNVNCHMAVPLLQKNGSPSSVSNSLGKADHTYFDMELHPAGVMVKYHLNGKGLLIPYSNVQHIQLELAE